MSQRLARTREELATFLRARRARLTPTDVGLPSGKRRRTPGLRREEVAALAGVGLTWYTWLEQGREIGVSADFLDNLARVLKLDAAERRHLFLLAQSRPPSEPGRTWCIVPPLVIRLMQEMAPHAAYVLNLRWDILAYNRTAAHWFGLDAHPPARRNLLWLLYTDAGWRDALPDWPTEAPRLLSSFQRDYARATQEADIQALVDELRQVAPDFSHHWARQEAQAPWDGQRRLRIDGHLQPCSYTSLTLDGERHLRLVVHARDATPSPDTAPDPSPVAQAPAGG